MSNTLVAYDEKRGWEGLLLLVGAAALLVASLWLLAFAGETAWQGFSPWPDVLRQGAIGLSALALAWGGGHFSLHHLLLRTWYFFPALLVLVMLAALFSEALGMVRLVDGHGWWTRSMGVSAYLLALVFSVSYVLPRFARDEVGSGWAMALIIVLLAVVAVFFLKQVGCLVAGMAVCGLACSATLAPRKLAVALSGLLAVSVCALLVKFAIAPEALQLLSYSLSIEKDESFQLYQALLAVHSGGLLGWTDHQVWIPHWHTDFMFAYLCGSGGLVAGFIVLLAIGLMFTLAWRIAIRQRDVRAKALGAACVGALFLPALLHVAVNLGWFPTLGINFPFLSYGPTLLVLNGLLLGLLLSLARQPIVPAGEGGGPITPGTASRPPGTMMPASAVSAVWAVWAVWGVLALFAFRIGALVYAALPGLH